MKYLIITKCNDSKKWYADKIGYSFPIISAYADGLKGEYKTRQPEGYINFISLEDAEVIRA